MRGIAEEDDPAPVPPLQGLDIGDIGPDHPLTRGSLDDRRDRPGVSCREPSKSLLPLPRPFDFTLRRLPPPGPGAPARSRCPEPGAGYSIPDHPTSTLNATRKVD